MSALGMIEVYGYTTSIIIADTVAKAAEVKVVAIAKNKAATADSVEVPLVMVVKFEGNAGAVQSALDAGVAEAQRRGLYITSKVIEASNFSKPRAAGAALCAFDIKWRGGEKIHALVSIGEDYSFK